MTTLSVCEKHNKTYENKEAYEQALKGEYMKTRNLSKSSLPIFATISAIGALALYVDSLSPNGSQYKVYPIGSSLEGKITKCALVCGIILSAAAYYANNFVKDEKFSCSKTANKCKTCETLIPLIKKSAVDSKKIDHNFHLLADTLLLGGVGLQICDFFKLSSYFYYASFAVIAIAGLRFVLSDDSKTEEIRKEDFQVINTLSILNFSNQ